MTENNKLSKLYNSKFFTGQVDKSHRSAKEYMTYLFNFYKPNSIVDFGCGTGAWLMVAQDLGVKDLLGIDGEWIQGQQIDTEKINYKLENLEQSIKLQRKFDLAISLEVAEHLTENRAKSFVSDICCAADLVLFGAAIKGQGGINHINEQLPSYWINLFRENNYECLDFFRGNFWDSQNIGSGYIQNTFLYLKKGDERKKLFSQAEIKPIYDVYHPIIFERYRHPKYCGLKTYIRTTPRIPQLIVKAISRRLRSRK